MRHPPPGDPRRAIPIAAALLGILSTSSGARTEDEAFFRERVASIFAERCGECHGPDVPRPKAGLRFSSREALIAGGMSGPAVVPGDPDASLLVRAIRYEDESLQMPPSEQLPADEIDALVEWVRGGAPWVSEPVSPEAARLFEQEIRPLLAEHCFRCHGPELDQVEGGLRMAGRAGFLRGGNHGPALVPGDPSDSRLVTALHYDDRYLRMPPDGKLDDAGHRPARAMDRARCALAERRRPGARARGARTRHRDGALVVGLSAGDAPRGAGAPRRERGRGPDRCLRAGAPRGAGARAQSDRRRPHADPPAVPGPARRAAHLRGGGAPSSPTGGPTRWERLVDSAARTSGVRRALGRATGSTWCATRRPTATSATGRSPWPGATATGSSTRFNRDLPYDRFLALEQLAGDELPDAGEDALVATGLLPPWGRGTTSPTTREQAELRRARRRGAHDQRGHAGRHARLRALPRPQVRSVPAGGLLLAARLPARTCGRYETPAHSLDSAVLRPLAATPGGRGGLAARPGSRAGSGQSPDPGDRGRGSGARTWRPIWTSSRNGISACRTPVNRRSPAQDQSVRSMLAKVPPFEQLAGEMDIEQRHEYLLLLEQANQLETSFPGDLDWALAVSEAGARARTDALARARPGGDSPARRSRRASSACCARATPRPSRPRRLRRRRQHRASFRIATELAEWIASPENPLTARVIVNRIWQHHFGRGIVPTPNDFGRAGLPPTHPELLDWLASEFVDGGWSLKALHRRDHDSPRRTAGPRARTTSSPWSSTRPTSCSGARTCAGSRPRPCAMRCSARPARSSRDRPSTGSAVRVLRAALARGARAACRDPGSGWGRSPAEEQARRTVYGFVKRGIQVPLLEVFDLANPRSRWARVRRRPPRSRR